MGRNQNYLPRSDVLMIVDDTFIALMMFALVGVIYLAYKVGEYVGQMKSDK